MAVLPCNVPHRLRAALCSPREVRVSAVYVVGVNAYFTASAASSSPEPPVVPFNVQRLLFSVVQ